MPRSYDDTNDYNPQNPQNQKSQQQSPQNALNQPSKQGSNAAMGQAKQMGDSQGSSMNSPMIPATVTNHTNKSYKFAEGGFVPNNYDYNEGQSGPNNELGNAAASFEQFAGQKRRRDDWKSNQGSGWGTPKAKTDAG